jgi:hypothetical protein
MRFGPIAVLALAGAMLVGCGGHDGDTSEPTATATTADDGTTLPGTELSLGDVALVDFAPTAKHESVLSIAVNSVKQGKIKDLSQFDLSPADKASTLYYVKAVVTNEGRADLAGEFVPLYGKVSDSLIVQPVVFGSTFKACNYQPLPKKFVKGKKVPLCVVLLVPKHGTVSAIEWRGDDEAPISWILEP